jgi:hypothetical protein
MQPFLNPQAIDYNRTLPADKIDTNKVPDEVNYCCITGCMCVSLCLIISILLPFIART